MLYDRIAEHYIQHQDGDFVQRQCALYADPDHCLMFVRGKIRYMKKMGWKKWQSPPLSVRPERKQHDKKREDSGY
jgi:hypothetical protein